MKIEKITCLGINEQLKNIQKHTQEIDNILYNMGYGISDLRYYGYSIEKIENARIIQEELKENVKNIKYILEQAICEDIDQNKIE